MPKVSVIIPNYNHAKFLHHRISSVLNQSFSDFEVIILDDCSTDNSQEIIDNFSKQDKRIKTFYNNKNSGSTFKQWKKGIDKAKGKYIWIAESDDYADLSLLKYLVDKLRIDTITGIAYCQSNFVNQKNEITGNHLKNLQTLDSNLWQKDFCISGEETLSKYMVVMNIIPNVSAAIFRKDLINYVNWEKLIKFKLAGDRFFWISMLAKSNLCFISQSLNYFRIDGNTVRSKHYNTVGYLNEILDLVIIICSNTKVKFYTKNKTMKSWLIRTYIAARDNSNFSKELSVKRTFSILYKIIRIYFKHNQ